jgi:hypothetical protein
LKNAPGPVHGGILDTNFGFEPPTSRKPGDLVPMWPLTHGERIEELKFLMTFYKETGQESNVKAAIDWHAEFPQDTLVGDESAYFQNGVIVKESERDLQAAPCWYEVSYNSYSL